MPFERVRDLELYHELHGAGDPVVLISGTGADLRTDPNRGRGPLPQAFQVLMYDQRGLGRTSKPDRPCTMSDYAEDCVALLDAIGWERAHVLGVSFGGMVAQHLALDHPERVDRLVLACTSSGGAGGSSFDLLAVHDLPTEERLAVVAPILDMRNDLSVDPPVLAPGFDQILTAMRAGPRNADDPAAGIGARRQLEARAGHDTWARLPELTAPTLVVGGHYDAQAPVANVERLAERLPRAELRLYDGGHLFLWQDPRAWADIVAFLGGEGPGSMEPTGAAAG